MILTFFFSIFIAFIEKKIFGGPYSVFPTCHSARKIRNMFCGMEQRAGCRKVKRSRETLMVQLRLEPELAVVSVCCMHVFSSTISRASIDVERRCVDKEGSPRIS